MVSQEDAINKSKQYNIAFLETSALQAVNIDKIFSLMVEEISNKMKINVENQEGENPEINGNAIDIQKNIHLDDYDKQEETNEGKNKKGKKNKKGSLRKGEVLTWQEKI